MTDGQKIFKGFCCKWMEQYKGHEIYFERESLHDAWRISIYKDGILKLDRGSFHRKIKTGLENASEIIDGWGAEK